MVEHYVSSVPPLWASVFSWFTPTVLFLFLNLTIGTIVVASSFAARKHHQRRHESERCSSPSFLHRLRSFSFSSSVEKTPESEAHEWPQLARSPSLLQRLTSFDYFSHESCPAPANQSQMSKQERGEDEQARTMDEMTRKMPRSASANTSSEEDNADGQRPATMNGDKEGLAMEDEEVDAKADDFINKFKHQLKLQRLESIMRYN